MKKLNTLIDLKKFLAGLFLMVLVAGCQVTVHDDHHHVPPPPPPPNPCGNVGVAGWDGLSFISLDFSSIEPEYIWGNNGSIPNYFSYGVFYQSNPGIFQLYYEGAFMDGCCLTEYFWDIEYELWYHPGTPGGPCGQPGLDGVDAYLEIWMDPYGPDFDRINKKSPEGFTVLENKDSKKSFEQKTQFFTYKVTYTKLDSSKKSTLDAAGIMKSK